MLQGLQESFEGSLLMVCLEPQLVQLDRVNQALLRVQLVPLVQLALLVQGAKILVPQYHPWDLGRLVYQVHLVLQVDR